MKRRDFLRTTGLLGTSALMAGCTHTTPNTPSANNTTTHKPITTTPTPPTPHAPTITWTDHWQDGNQYTVTAHGSLGTTNELLFKTNTRSLAKIHGTSNNTFSVDLATTKTTPATLPRGTTITAVNPNHQPPTTVDTHVVGSTSQKHPFSYLDELSGHSTLQKPSQPTTYSRTYTQTAAGHRSNITVNIPKYLYTYYQSQIRTQDWGTYISDTYDNSTLTAIINSIRRFSTRQNLSKRQTADTVIAFVQDLKYEHDSVSTGHDEYPKYPIETLVEQNGDCEDTSILLAALLNNLGYNTVLLAFYNKHHMAVGVSGIPGSSGTSYTHNGTEYYYLETTASGYRPGDTPSFITSSTTASIYNINDRPSLSNQWQLNLTQQNTLELPVTVVNSGEATATPVVKGFLQDKQKNVVASGKTTLNALPVQQQSQQTIPLPNPPQGKPVRGLVQVEIDGSLHDQSTSPYHSPSNPVPASHPPSSTSTATS